MKPREGRQRAGIGVFNVSAPLERDDVFRPSLGSDSVAILKPDQAHQFVVAELVDVVDGGDEGLGFGDVGDLVGVGVGGDFDGDAGVRLADLFVPRGDGDGDRGGGGGEAGDGQRAEHEFPPWGRLSGEAGGAHGVIGEAAAGGGRGRLVEEFPDGVVFPRVVVVRCVAVHGGE